MSGCVAKRLERLAGHTTDQRDRETLRELTDDPDVGKYFQTSVFGRV